MSWRNPANYNFSVLICNPLEVRSDGLIHVRGHKKGKHGATQRFNASQSSKRQAPAEA